MTSTRSGPLSPRVKKHGSGKPWVSQGSTTCTQQGGMSRQQVHGCQGCTGSMQDRQAAWACGSQARRWVLGSVTTCLKGSWVAQRGPQGQGERTRACRDGSGRLHKASKAGSFEKLPEGTGKCVEVCQGAGGTSTRGFLKRTEASCTWSGTRRQAQPPGWLRQLAPTGRIFWIMRFLWARLVEWPINRLDPSHFEMSKSPRVGKLE